MVNGSETRWHTTAVCFQTTLYSCVYDPFAEFSQSGKNSFSIVTSLALKSCVRRCYDSYCKPAWWQQNKATVDCWESEGADDNTLTFTVGRELTAYGAAPKISLSRDMSTFEQLNIQIVNGKIVISDQHRTVRMVVTNCVQ